MKAPNDENAMKAYNFNTFHRADFEIDDEDLMEATKSVIDNLELDERFYHKSST